MSETNALDRSSGAHHFDLFDGLRALAALLVVLVHVAGATLYTSQLGFLPDIARRLNVGVAIFFAISGFLLYRPFVARRIEGRGLGNVRRYGRRRFFRIVPPYWIALTALAIWPGLLSVFSTDAWVYYGFLQIYGPGDVYHGLVPAWSLCIEVTFYAFLPLYAWFMLRGARGKPAWRTEVAGLVALTACAILSHWLLARNGFHHAEFYLSLIGRFDWFVPGMALAVASVYVQHASNRPRILDVVARVPLASWAIAVALYVVLSTKIPDIATSPGPASVVIESMTYALISFFVLLPAVFGEHEGGLPRRILGWRPVAFLGLTSYGIYLYHYPLAYWWAEQGHGRAVVLVGTVTMTIAAAIASWYLVERPILRWSRRSEGGASSPPAAPAPVPSP